MPLQDGDMEHVWERSSQSTEGADTGLPSHGAVGLQEGGQGLPTGASTQASNTTRHFGETQKAVEFITQNAGVGEVVTPSASQERDFSANSLFIPTHPVSAG